MKRILTCLDYYIPGYKSGGPLRTVSNMVEQMGNNIEFWIVTRDRDATDKKTYPSISVNTWNDVDQAKVYYASPGNLSLISLHRLAEAVIPDALYLNSFFSPLTIRWLILRKMRAMAEVPVVIAPRGELSQGALALKSKKKRLYIAAVQKLGLYDGMLWQASSPLEADEILSLFPRAAVQVAPDVPALVPSGRNAPNTKEPKSAKFIFLSRISPKKNLFFLLKQLGSLSGEIELSIVGPVRDADYWRSCQEVIQKLPNNVQVNVIGSVPHDEVHSVLTQHHFFVLPTLGENFGHAVLEAMGAGTPVLISDQTPWQHLPEKGAGWDIALDNRDRWQEVMQHCVDMTQREYTQFSESAYAFAVQWSSDNDILRANYELFEKAVSR